MKNYAKISAADGQLLNSFTAVGTSYFGVGIAGMNFR